MTGTWRTAPLPPNWYQLRQACKANADGQCQAVNRDGQRCPQDGNEAHHAGTPNDHTNLVWLCHWHHMRITQQQAAAARKASPTPRETRPPEKHPGLTNNPTRRIPPPAEEPPPF